MTILSSDYMSLQCPKCVNKFRRDAVRHLHYTHNVTTLRTPLALAGPLVLTKIRCYASTTHSPSTKQRELLSHCRKLNICVSDSRRDDLRESTMLQHCSTLSCSFKLLIHSPVIIPYVQNVCCCLQ